MEVLCPECGKILNSEKVDIRKHAVGHWGVSERDLHRMTNREAVRRYNTLITAAEKADLERDMISPKIPDVKEVLEEGGV